MSRFLMGLAVIGCGALAGAAEFQFATATQGAAILTADDDYLRALSPADPALRLLSTKRESLPTLKQAYAANVLEWNEVARARIAAVLERQRVEFAALARWLPERVYFVLVTNAVEGGLPHTRANAIIMPAPFIDAHAKLDAVIAHELFHVLSRNNPARRDALYALIGFAPCHVIEPATYAARRITNPDAPSLAHYLPLTDDAAQGLVPYLYAAANVFDPTAGAHFDNQFRPGFLHVKVSRAAGGPRCEAYPGDADPMQPLSAYKDFIERKTGGNSGYLIHPEETLADNFALLLLGSEQPVPSPWVLEKLARWLEIPAPARPKGSG